MYRQALQYLRVDDVFVTMEDVQGTYVQNLNYYPLHVLLDLLSLTNWNHPNDPLTEVMHELSKASYSRQE
jgi:hypothetical protein